MDHATVHPSDGSPQTSMSAASSIDLASPTTSIFTRGHSSKGSGSSIASSPIARESLDMHGGAKRLEDVTEEPQEKDEFSGYTLVDNSPYDLIDYNKAFADSNDHLSSPSSPVQPDWTLANTSDWSTPPLEQRQFKRPRSMDQVPRPGSHRLSGRLGSLSRRWRNRSAAGPQLSLVTHINSPASRSGSLNGSQILSPALSAISKHESVIASSPSQAATSQTSFEPETKPVDIDYKPSDQEEPSQATTPLLPPVFSELCTKEPPIQSPLQSPSIAPTAAMMSSRTSMETPPLSYLPSPPLSTKPSMVSLCNRSRTSTITGEIPPLQLLDDIHDPWAVKLGHANFSIHPEPYVPEETTLDSYAEFRNNWDQARTNYAKQIARTAEHYGPTSKVYRLTEEKWTTIDSQWKRQHNIMRKAMAPLLARLSDGDSEMQESTASSAVLEKPPTKVVLPVIDDKSGKFPELGDMEIIGPMSVARPRALTYPQKTIDSRGSPPSPHKRNLFKIISEIFRS